MKRIEQLRRASSLSEVALLLGFQPKAFAWVIYQQPTKYVTFTVPKSRGGVRTIQAPEDKLKNVQSRLAALLQDCIADINTKREQVEKLSHGFRRGHSIMTNAYQHRRRKFVFNVDLEDFFGAINFGRVRGFFRTNKHFLLSERSSTVLAHIACADNSLPQGAPSSPVISNLIAHILDVRLAKIARRYGLHYTRYADDLTFSTNANVFPEAIAVQDPSGKWLAGDVLERTIIRAGFAIQPTKTRMQFRQSRQDVTGLVVNQKVNVRAEYYRDARAKCDKLFKTGRFTNKIVLKKDDGTVEVKESEGTIEQLAGVLSFIDGVKIFKKKITRDHALSGPERLYKRFLFYNYFFASGKPLIICEGKTDNIYLRCAIESLAYSYRRLIEEKDGVTNHKVRLFNYTPSNKRLLGLAGGTGHLNTFIKEYRENLKSFTAIGERFPVILLIDNDSGADGVFKCIRAINKIACDGTAPFYFLGDNLYLVPTPRSPTGGHSMIEDFLPQKWRSTLLNGKTLNLGSNLDVSKEYGKALFAEHVIKKNRKNVVFDDMRGILDRIVEVIIDYEKMVVSP